MNSENVAKKDVFFSLGFFCVILIEFFLFRSYILREIVNYYPSSYDQASYLSIVYSLYESILKEGWHLNLITMGFYPTSISFLSQVAVFFIVFGASRFSALLFGFCCFVILQVALTRTIFFLTRSYAAATIFLGLVLSISTPFYICGGLADFRIDFTAFCLYGIFVSSVIRSQIFFDRKWTMFSIFFASWLMLTRTISIVFVFELLFFIGMYYLFKLYFYSRSDVVNILNIKKHLKNIVLFFCVSLLIVTPFLWYTRDLIYRYYVLGHFIEKESHVRSIEFGITNIYDNLFFYPHSVAMDHLGILAIFLLCSLLVAVFIVKYWSRINSSITTLFILEDSLLYFKDMTIFLILAILSPLLILITDDSKSPVVGGIMIIPILWLTILCFVRFFKVNHDDKKKIANFSLNILGGAFLFIGLFHWFISFGTYSAVHLNDKNSTIEKMYEDIGNYAQEVDWKTSVLSTDQTVDYLRSTVLETLYYEKYGNIVNATQTRLGGSIFAISQKEALDDLSVSNVFILNLDDNYSFSPYPYNQEIEKLRPVLQNALNKDFIPLNNYYFNNFQYRVYVRPCFGITGLSGDWITSQGIWLQIPNVLLQTQRITNLTLEGESNSWIDPNTKVSADFEKNGEKMPLVASINFLKGHYKIILAAPDKILTNKGITKIHLIFSKYFIPSALKINGDTRKLVLMKPIAQFINLKK